MKPLVCQCTYFSIIFIDVLIVGHFHQAVTKVVVGEDEETGFQVAVDFFQILEKKIEKWNECINIKFTLQATRINYDFEFKPLN